MIRHLRSSLLIIFAGAILCASSTPASAGVVVGLSPKISSLSTNPQNLTLLTEALRQQLKEDVKVRSFDSAEALQNWLLRFREVDVALLPAPTAASLPAGATVHLLDLHARRDNAVITKITVRADMSPTQQSALSRALLTLHKTRNGQKTLQTLGIRGIVKPGQPAPQPRVTPKKPSVNQTVQTRQTPEPTPTEATAPTQKSTAAAIKSKTSLPARKAAPLTQATPTKETDNVTKKVVTKLAPAADPVLKTPAAPAEPASGTTVADDPAPTAQQSLAADIKQGRPTGLASSQPLPPNHKTNAPQGASDVRLTIFLLLLLTMAIVIKASMLLRHLQSKKKNRQRPDTPTLRPSYLKKPATRIKASGTAQTSHSNALPQAADRQSPGASPPHENSRQTPAAKTPSTVINEGRLDDIRVPALLKRCAAHPDPVQLLITQSHGEKIISFIDGKLTSLLIRKNMAQEHDFSSQQLLYLLTRDNLLAPTDHDQVIAAVEKGEEPDIITALHNRNLIEKSSLQAVIEWQLKSAVFALVLFPEGHFQVTPLRPVQPAVKTVRFDVTELISEAAQHRAEWTAIRKLLPNLGTCLQFQPEGRSKLEHVGLSVQQQLLLAQIDGQHSLGDLCRESIMVDYEIYRFLYMMQKAGVLQHVTTP